MGGGWGGGGGGGGGGAQLVLPSVRCEPVVHHIYSLLRIFLHLGAPTILEVSLALFRSAGWCDFDSAKVVPAV